MESVASIRNDILTMAGEGKPISEELWKRMEAAAKDLPRCNRLISVSLTGRRGLSAQVYKIRVEGREYFQRIDREELALLDKECLTVSHTEEKPRRLWPLQVGDREYAVVNDPDYCMDQMVTGESSSNLTLQQLLSKHCPGFSLQDPVATARTEALEMVEGGHAVSAELWTRIADLSRDLPRCTFLKIMHYGGSDDKEAYVLSAKAGEEECERLVDPEEMRLLDESEVCTANSWEEDDGHRWPLELGPGSYAVIGDPEVRLWLTSGGSFSNTETLDEVLARWHPKLRRSGDG